MIGDPSNLQDERERLPHGPEARWIDSVDAVDEGSIRCTATLPVESPLAGAPKRPSLVGLEMCAQAAGLHALLAGPARERPAMGYLVGLRDVALHEPFIHAGVAHEVAARRIAAGFGLAEYEVRLACGGRPVLSGRLKTWMPA